MSIKKEILKAAGVKSEKEFYKKFPNEESFLAAHPDFKMKLGGSLPEAFNMTMPMDKFFSYGVPVPPTYLQKGGSRTVVLKDDPYGRQRLKAYEDSLDAHNRTLAAIRFIEENKPDALQASTVDDVPSSINNIRPSNVVFPFSQSCGPGTGNSCSSRSRGPMSSPVPYYEKPKEKVILKKDKPKTSTSTSTSSTKTKTSPTSKNKKDDVVITKMTPREITRFPIEEQEIDWSSYNNENTKNAPEIKKMPMMRASQRSRTGQYQTGNYVWNPDLKQWTVEEFEPEEIQKNFKDLEVGPKTIPYAQFEIGGSLTNVPVFPQAQTEAQFFVPTYSNSNNAYKKGGNIVGGSYLEVHPEARNLGWSPTNYFMLQQGGVYDQNMTVPGTLPMLQQGSLQMGGNPQGDQGDQAFYAKKLNSFFDKIRQNAIDKIQKDQEEQLANIQAQDVQDYNYPVEEVPMVRYGGIPKFQKGSENPFLSKEQQGRLKYEESVKKQQEEDAAWIKAAEEIKFKNAHGGLSPAEYDAMQKAAKEISEGKTISTPKATKPAEAPKTTKRQTTTASTTTQPAKTTTTTQPVTSTTAPSTTSTTDGTTAATTTSTTTTPATTTTDTTPKGWQKVNYRGMPGVVDPETGQVYLSDYNPNQYIGEDAFQTPRYYDGFNDRSFSFRDPRGVYNFVDLFSNQKTRWRDIKGQGFDRLTAQQLEAIKSGLANVADVGYETKRRGLLQKIGIGKPDVSRVNIKFRTPGTTPGSPINWLQGPSNTDATTNDQTTTKQSSTSPASSYGPYLDNFVFPPDTSKGSAIDYYKPISGLEGIIYPGTPTTTGRTFNPNNPEHRKEVLEGVMNSPTTNAVEYSGDDYQKRFLESGKTDPTTGEYILTDPNNPGNTTVYQSYDAFLSSQDGNKIVKKRHGGPYVLPMYQGMTGPSQVQDTYVPSPLLTDEFVANQAAQNQITDPNQMYGPYADAYRFGPVSEEFEVGLDIGKEKKWDPFQSAKIQFAASTLANLGQRKRDRERLTKMSRADQNFAAMQPGQGDYVMNAPAGAFFRPDDFVPVGYTGAGSYAQYGGAQEDFIVSGDNYYLTPQMLMKLQRFIR